MWRQIYPVLPAIISVPAANGFLERTFSACTNFDDELCQRLKAGRFEMAVLLAVNECFRRKIASDEEVKDIVEKAIARFTKSPDFNASKDLGLTLKRRT